MGLPIDLACPSVPDRSLNRAIPPLRRVALLNRLSGMESKQPAPAPAPAPKISPKSPGEISEGQAPPIPSPSRTPKPSSIVDDDPDSIQSSRASSRTPAPAVPPKDPTPIPPKASTSAVPPKDATPPPPTRPLSRSSIASSRASVKPSTPQPDAFPGLELDAPSQLGDASPTPLTSEGALPTPNASEALPTPITSEASGADVTITNADRPDHVPTPRDSAASSRIHTPTPPTIEPESPADVTIRVQPNEARSKGSPGTLLSTIPPIPSFDDEVGDDAEPSTFDDGLRAFVIDHLLYHDQTRAERNEAVLAGNLAISHPQVAYRVPTSPKTLVKEISEPIAQRPDDDGIGTTLENLMENLNTMLTTKQQRLREEYLALNERWKRHCAKLDAQAREMAEPEITHGRSTRRNAALGDTIRSDLEMEQIIASLSVDEATNPDIVSQRNQATIPDMISVTQGHVPYSYNDNNLRVYDPEEYYAPETGIHDWSPEERDIMLRQYAQTPKQFGYIADKLPNKTAEQCVDFYYLHKKQLLDFRKAVTTYGPKKRGGRRMGKRKGNALLADIAQHDAEVREEVKGPIATRRTRRAQVIATEARRTSARRAASHAETGTSATATPEPEGSGRTTRRRKVPASKGPASAVRSAQPSRQASPEASKAATPVLSNQATPQPEAGPDDAGSTKPEAAPPPSVSVVAQSLLLPMIPAPKPTPPLPSSSSKTIEEPDDGAASNRPAKRFKRPGKKYKKSAEIIDDDMEEAAGSKPLPPPSTSSPAATSAPVIMNPAGWTDADTATLLILLQEHGMNFDRIAAAMPGKTVADVTMVCQNNMVLSSIAQSMGTNAADSNAKTDSDASKSTTTTKVASTITKTPAPTTNMHPYAMYGGMSMQPPTMPMTAPPNTMQMQPNTMQMQPGTIPMPHIPPYMQSPMYPPPPMHYARYPEYYPRDYWPPPFPGIGGYPGYPPMAPLSQAQTPAQGASSAAGSSQVARFSQTSAPGASTAAGSSKAPAGSSQPAAPAQPNGTSDKPSGAASAPSKTPPAK
ncbi:hypothetical protein K525DRAFT_285872 [Schizophyllum commune Loenen D]|nr:hypothetical protein K525DRAFT_285872 [Schizophyllum commune Loenen D]